MKKTLLLGTPTSLAALAQEERAHHFNNFSVLGEFIGNGIERAQKAGYTHFRALDSDSHTARLVLLLAAIGGLAPDAPAIEYVVTKVVECEGESPCGLYATEAEAITAAVALAVIDDDQVTSHDVTRWCGADGVRVWDSDRPYTEWG